MREVTKEEKRERTDVCIRNKSEVATESDYSVVAHTKRRGSVDAWRNDELAGCM